MDSVDLGSGSSGQSSRNTTGAIESSAASGLHSEDKAGLGSTRQPPDRKGENLVLFSHEDLPLMCGVAQPAAGRVGRTMACGRTMRER